MLVTISIIIGNLTRYENSAGIGTWRNVGRCPNFPIQNLPHSETLRAALLATYYELPECDVQEREAAVRDEVKRLREAMEELSGSAQGLARQRDDARASLARAKAVLRRMAPVGTTYSTANGFAVQTFER